MKINIDARMAGHFGVGRYIQNLIKAISQIDTKNEYHIYINKNQNFSSYPANFIFRKLKFYIRPYSLLGHIYLPLCFENKPSLNYYPNFNVPLLDSGKIVVTIHDLIYYLFPADCPSKRAYYYARMLIKETTRKARFIITDSEFSKKDIITYLKVSPEKVKVVYPGIGEGYKPVLSGEDLKRFRDKYNIHGDFLYYTGNHLPHKNLERLLEAFKIVRGKYPLKLVLGGGKIPRRKSLYQYIDQLGFNNDVILMDYLPEEELPFFYQACKIFVFPSFYEGFGLPVLEAMACGACVISSNSSSLPELVGQSALLIDPDSTQNLVNAIEKLLSNEKLMNDMKKKGLERAKNFPWQNTARKILDIFNEV